VEHVLLNGATRQDEMRRSREVIGNDEAVLERNRAELPDAIVVLTGLRRILDLVDGRRYGAGRSSARACLPVPRERLLSGS